MEQPQVYNFDGNGGYGYGGLGGGFIPGIIGGILGGALFGGGFGGWGGNGNGNAAAAALGAQATANNNADFLGSSVVDNGRLALYVKDLLDDPDGYDELVFNRFLMDCMGRGIPIMWEDML